MSYCRISNESDVYVIRDITGQWACFCDPASTFVADTRRKMYMHLLEHRAAGHRVPERVFERLRVEDDRDHYMTHCDLEYERLCGVCCACRGTCDDEWLDRDEGVVSK